MSRPVEVRMDEPEIAVVHFDDGARANALDEETIEALLAALDEARALRPKALILQGTPEVFCSGASRDLLLEMCDGKVTAAEIKVPEALLDLPCPVIAAMEGHALGGGLALAVCSDLVVAARESRYGAVFTALGLTPGMGCTALLADLVGPFVAAEMMYTARPFRGRELAARRTQINRIVPREQVLAVARQLARSIAQKERLVVELLKSALAVRKKSLLATARQQEEQMHRICLASPATRENIEMGFLP